MNFQKISNNIKKLREAAGMSIDELSEKSGFSKGFLSNLENATDDRANPTLDTLEGIAHALGTDLHALLEAHEHSGDHFEVEYGERSSDRD